MEKNLIVKCIQDQNMGEYEAVMQYGPLAPGGISPVPLWEDPIVIGRTMSVVGVKYCIYTFAKSSSTVAFTTGLAA